MLQGSDVAARSERRGHRPPIPANIKSLLTQEQALGLRNVENFGWQLAFVRQPLFEPPVTVVVSPDHQRFAVLEPDGRVNMELNITLRS
ncbi:MAG: hypothetical protein H6955_14130 [Chromatiaceae bacterium]|nr:hypothetical protein [Gammaproteobacteria bacterium]MCP5314692.1 hypothetical protein [Chromatiaceae bacterium]